MTEDEAIKWVYRQCVAVCDENYWRTEAIALNAVNAMNILADMSGNKQDIWTIRTDEGRVWVILCKPAQPNP